MTGAEHYIAAEAMTALAVDESNAVKESVLLRYAEVHATLAVAAAIASATVVLAEAEQKQDAEQWRDVLGLFADGGQNGAAGPVAAGYPCCQHCQFPNGFCDDGEPLHGEPCEECAETDDHDRLRGEVVDGYHPGAADAAAAKRYEQTGVL